MAAVLALLIIVLLSVVVNRIGAAALTLTGLSREMARFQARSAFSTTGYATNEAEAIVNHPVRRRIIYILMMIGNVGFVGVIATTVATFTVRDDDPYSLGARLGLIGTGLALLLVLATSKWVDDQLFKVIAWALRRWTMDEIHDYRSLLHLGHGFSVTEIPVESSDWPVGKRLDELRLSQVGINVLGIHREDDDFVNTPVGATYVRGGDRLIVYGSRKDVTRFNESRGEEDGPRAFQRLADERAPEVAAALARRMQEERRRLEQKRQDQK